MSRELEELQEIARTATRDALRRYEPIAPDMSKQLILGTLFEGDDRVFELYVPGERPADALVYASARVNRITREVSVQVKNLSLRVVDSTSRNGGGMPNLEFNRTACAAWASRACGWSLPAQAAQAAGQRRR